MRACVRACMHVFFISAVAFSSFPGESEAQTPVRLNQLLRLNFKGPQAVFLNN